MDAYSTPSLLQHLTQEAERRFRIISVWNDKCLEWQVFGRTSVRNDNDFVIQIFHDKNFFCSNQFPSIFKTSPRSQGIYRYTWQTNRTMGSVWKKQTYRHTNTRTSANHYMDLTPHHWKTNKRSKFQILFSGNNTNPAHDQKLKSPTPSSLHPS